MPSTVFLSFFDRVTVAFFKALTSPPPREHFTRLWQRPRTRRGTRTRQTEPMQPDGSIPPPAPAAAPAPGAQQTTEYQTTTVSQPGISSGPAPAVTPARVPPPMPGSPSMRRSWGPNTPGAQSMRQPANPASTPGRNAVVSEGTGAAFHFNPATGMLENPGGSGGEAMSKSRFVESSSTGGFRRVLGGGAIGAGDAAAGSIAQRAIESQGDQTMRAVAVAVQSAVVWLGTMTQGLLAGFAVLHLFMTYYLDAEETDGFLKYYSPIALPAQRCFVALSALALITSVDKYARDSLSGFMLQGFTLQKVDALAVLSFFLCFVLSVVCVPFEDRIYYANKRVPGWWEFNTASSAFSADVQGYMGTNFARCFFGLLGWACVCYTTTPRVIDVLDRAEEMKNPRMGVLMNGNGSDVPRSGVHAGTEAAAKEGGALQLGWREGGNGGASGRRQRMDGYGR